MIIGTKQLKCDDNMNEKELTVWNFRWRRG